jgi:hypothetical protein
MNNRIMINLVLITVVFGALILGCSDADDSKVETAVRTIPKAYIALWTADDGSTVTIRSDKSGDYKFGGKSVSGGSVEVDEDAKEIRFTMLGFDAGKYKIDQPPTGDRMKLDGLLYRRTAGAVDEKDPAADLVSVPAEDDLRALVYRSMLTFSQAVKKGDFTEFQAAAAERLRDEISAAKLKDEFASTIKNKFDYAPKSVDSLEFTVKPFIEKEKFLNVTVKYPNAAGQTPTIQIDYLHEGEEWKLAGIQLNPDAKGK